MSGERLYPTGVYSLMWLWFYLGQIDRADNRSLGDSVRFYFLQKETFFVLFSVRPSGNQFVEGGVTFVGEPQVF